MWHFVQLKQHEYLDKPVYTVRLNFELHLVWSAIFQFVDWKSMFTFLYCLELGLVMYLQNGKNVIHRCRVDRLGSRWSDEMQVLTESKVILFSMTLLEIMMSWTCVTCQNVGTTKCELFVVSLYSKYLVCIYLLSILILWFIVYLYCIFSQFIPLCWLVVIISYDFWSNVDGHVELWMDVFVWTKLCYFVVSLQTV